MVESHHSDGLFACRQCHTKTTNIFICEDCRLLRIPLPEHNYFSAFQIVIKFSPDKKLLEDKYEDLLELIHPDLFISQDETHQSASLNYSAILQEAKETLINDMRCGLHILEIYKKRPTKENLQPSVKFLTEMLVFQEELLENSDQDGFKIEINDLYNKKHTKLSTLFGKFLENPNSNQEEVLSALYSELGQFKFISNLYQQSR
ncbi:MAG: hypothetical protein JJV97_01800 [SAR324 cluster bacterium]|nr:hypothetical protein [SAR324 cluster bacterium]